MAKARVVKRLQDIWSVQTTACRGKLIGPYALGFRV